MQTAASLQHPAKQPHVACIRLIQGASDDAVWVLEAGVGGTFLTIGADPECEWQIRAAGVPAHAVSVLLVGGMVHVRSGPQRCARMNGTLLSEEWTPVERDARLDIGMASLEIKLGKDALLPSLREMAAPPAHEEPEAQTGERKRAPIAPERSGMRRSRSSRSSFPTDERATLAKARTPGWFYVLAVMAVAAAYTLFVIWLD